MRYILAAAAITLLFPGTVLAADHLDAPSVTGDAATDINDLYAWTSTDGSKLNLIMTVFPLADGTSTFSDSAQYVFHTTSYDAFGGTAGPDVDLICTFNTAQEISCWLGNMDYATGDASTSVTSSNGMFTVHTGLHDDPFFMNLEDFNATVEAVNAATGLTFDNAGCPDTSGGVSDTLVGILTGAADGAEDFFAPLNTLAIVVEVDLAAVNSGGDIVSVWGSTRMMP